MAIRMRRWAGLATSSLLVIGASVACGQIRLPLVQSGNDAVSTTGAGQPAPIPAEPVANATATPVKARPGALKSVPVRRDSLTETLVVDGTVAAEAQEPVTYAWRGIIDDVKVKVGESVKQGDILVEYNQGDIPKVLEAARAHVQTSIADLASAQAQAEASQAATAQRQAAEQRRQQQAVLDAETALNRAKDNLRQVQAGKPANERQAAASSVAYYGDTQVAAAQRALDAALAGPDGNTIQAAERDVANAEVTLKKAQSDLDTLTRGPDPAALRAAQATVQRAQAQLQIAQIAKIDPKAADPGVAKIQHDAAIQDAQTALDSAQAQVDKLKQPPAGVDVQAAKNRVVDAQTNLQNAQAKLDTLQAGPDPATVEAAQQKLEYAKHTLSEMQLQLDEVNSHPTRAELAAAQDTVRAAEAALENARQATPAQDQTASDPSSLQKVVDQAKADVAQAEQMLENTHLRAPFDGTVVAIRAKPGDATVPSRPVIIMARPGLPIVRIDLDDTQAGQVAAGQTAVVQAGTGASALRLVGTVKSVTPATPDGTRGASANVNVTWPNDESLRVGTSVQVTLNLGAKQDVLVVPKSALHKAGTRTTVEIQDGSARRLVPVQVGITTADSAEIVSGLTEGQTVLAAMAPV